MRKFKVLLVLFLGFSAAAFAGSSKTMYVCVKSAVVRASNSNFAKKVATVSYADQVQVVKEKGKWSQVSLNGGKTVGWVSTSSLSKRKIVASGSNFSATTDEIALAGKGFSAEVENLYKQTGAANYAAVDQMEKQNVTDDELKAFLDEGHLNGAE